jgi:endonuclease/exonuclease/phosphatase family metal-dependent hydrolase
MRVLTLNIWGYNNPYDYTLHRQATRGAIPGSRAAETQTASWPIRRGLIVNLIGMAQPDVAALQEVAVDPAVEGGRSSAEQIADRLVWNVLVASCVEGEGESLNAVALLSPHPIRERTRILLPDGRGRDSYLCLAADVEGPQGEIVALTAHFALAADGDRAHQIESARRILAFCQALPSRLRVVLMADLNAQPFEEPVQLLLREGEAFDGEPLRDAALFINGKTLPTMPSHAPAATLDYVLIRNLDAIACRTAAAPNAEGYYPSDHLALIAELQASKASNVQTS